METATSALPSFLEASEIEVLHTTTHSKLRGTGDVNISLEYTEYKPVVQKFKGYSGNTRMSCG